MAILSQQVQAVRTGQGYPVNITATSTFATQTIQSQFIRVSPTVNCFIKVGTSAQTAATTGFTGYLAAGVIEFKKCVVGDSIHAISATGALGVLTIEEVID